LTSRPPSAFELAWEGEHYAVWRRTDRDVAAHRVLGPDVLNQAAKPRCRDIEDLMEEAGDDGSRLAFVERREPRVLDLTEMDYTPAWGPYENYPGTLTFSGPGRAEGTVRVEEAQTFQVWVGASVSRRITVEVDGRPIGGVEDHLNNPGAYLPVGEVTLEPGTHDVRLSMGGGTLAPGDAGYGLGLRHIGPLVFNPAQNAVDEVRYIALDDWESLCGRRLDWVEVVG
jgi:hypothetical protein